MAHKCVTIDAKVTNGKEVECLTTEDMCLECHLGDALSMREETMVHAKEFLGAKAKLYTQLINLEERHKVA